MPSQTGHAIGGRQSIENEMKRKSPKKTEATAIEIGFVAAKNNDKSDTAI